MVEQGEALFPAVTICPDTPAAAKEDVLVVSCGTSVFVKQIFMLMITHRRMELGMEMAPQHVSIMEKCARKIFRGIH